MKEFLQDKLGHKVFYDADDLQDLGALTSYVHRSGALVLCQTKHIYTRPYCLLEIKAAMDANVPIIPVQIFVADKAKHYDFVEASEMLDNLDTTPLLDDGGRNVLRENGVVDVKAFGKQVKEKVCNIISRKVC